MMKIAFVTAFPDDPSSPRGGVEAVSVTLVEALQRLDDLDVHVVTTRESCTASDSSRWLRATIHRLPRKGRWTLTGAVGADRRQVREFLLALGPDVVHAHDTYGLMVKGLPVPRVFTIHGFIHADTALAGTASARVRAALWRSIETRGWADQPHIIAISPYVRERLHGIATGTIHDIDNPVARSCFDVDRRDGNGLVFSAGAVCRRKNTLALLDAFERVLHRGVDARLRLAGPVTEPDYGKAVHARIDQGGFGSRVELLGAISSADVRKELSSASVFALVSLEENSPLAVEEAMAVGVPVVTSGRCGMPYLVRDGDTGSLIDPTDADDIADALATILADSNLRRDMGRAARTQALERFHPDVVARRTRDVYRRARARARRGDATHGP